jgi:hypothetical protein
MFLSISASSNSCNGTSDVGRSASQRPWNSPDRRCRWWIDQPIGHTSFAIVPENPRPHAEMSLLSSRFGWFTPLMARIRPSIETVCAQPTSGRDLPKARAYMWALKRDFNRRCPFLATSWREAGLANEMLLQKCG